MKTKQGRALLGSIGLSLLPLATACTKESAEPAAAPQTAENPPAPAVADSGTSSDNGEATDVQRPQAAAEVIARKWAGDLDGMIQRRVIRVLTACSGANYLVDGGPGAAGSTIPCACSRTTSTIDSGTETSGCTW